MTFLLKTDIEKRINPSILAQITGGDDDIIDAAEADAIGLVRDQLTGMYDIAEELIKTGNDRHAALKLWLVSLTCYFLYAHIPDDEVPERIIKDYNDTKTDLNQIALGKMPTTLTPIINDDGTSKRVVRYGFNDKRSHEII